MKFYKGDIVEIIHIREHPIRQKVGYRFHVDKSNSDMVEVLYPYSFEKEEYTHLVFLHSQIFLYKRSIINWIRHYVN